MHLVHSGLVVTHRLASGAQPSGQQVSANAGDITAYNPQAIKIIAANIPRD
jgi:hypothetical protein